VIGDLKSGDWWFVVRDSLTPDRDPFGFATDWDESSFELRVSGFEKTGALLLLGLKLGLEQVCSTSCWKTDLDIFASSSGEGFRISELRVGYPSRSVGYPWGDPLGADFFLANK
jgi:hypothetical protein